MQSFRKEMRVPRTSESELSLQHCIFQQARAYSFSYPSIFVTPLFLGEFEDSFFANQVFSECHYVQEKLVQKHVRCWSGVGGGPFSSPTPGKQSH